MPCRATLSFILIPVCLASPREQMPKDDQLSQSVRTLVHNPRRGPARLTSSSGTRTNGYVMRVTNQFVAFREAPSQFCRNIMLSQIAAIDVRSPVRAPRMERYVSDAMITGIFAAFWIPGSLHRHLTDPTRRERITGDWHAKQASPDGTFTRLGIGLLENTRILRRQVRTQRGAYEVKTEKLSLRDDTGAYEVIPIRFVCDTLLLDTPGAPRKLIAAEFGTTRPADDPIVGKWRENLGEITTFQADGRFVMETTESSKVGHFEQSGSRLKVTWNSPSFAGAEQWDLQAKNDRLFVTVAGRTSEYTRR